MTGRDILAALSEIDDELIEMADVRRGAGAGAGAEAEAAGTPGGEKIRSIGPRSGRGWGRYTKVVIGAAAACILLLAAIPVIRSARVKTSNNELSGGSASAVAAEDSARAEEDGKVFLGQAATAYLDEEAADEAADGDGAVQDAYTDAADGDGAVQDAYTDAADEADGAMQYAYTDENEADGAALAPDTDAAAAAEYSDEIELESAGSTLTATANPFTEYASLAEAEEAVGFTLAAPAAFKGTEMTIIRGMDSKLLEVIYTDDSGEERFRLRKGVGSGDISGDYSEYSLVERLTLGESVVEIKGNEEDSVSLAAWECDGCSYALEAQLYPMTTEEFKEFKAQIGD